MKIVVNLDDTLTAQADALAGIRGWTRGELIAAAVRQYLGGANADRLISVEAVTVERSKPLRSRKYREWMKRGATEALRSPQ